MADVKAPLRGFADVGLADRYWTREPHVIDRLFEKVGGSETIKALVDRFYDRVLADPRLAPFFPNTDMAALRAKQGMFITMLLTASRTYKGPDLASAHAPARAQGMNDEHFDALLGHFDAALRDLKVEEDYRRELMALLEAKRNAVLGRETRLHTDCR